MWTAVAIIIFGMVLAGCKAYLAPIVHDEAATYLDSIKPEWDEMVRRFYANNHILNTLLAEACSRLFGIGEFALRIPAMLTRLLFLVAVYLITRRIIPARPVLRLVCLALMALQPLLLDFGACCRGYSLGLGWFYLGFYLCLQVMEPATMVSRLHFWQRLRWYAAASICFGLAIASVQIFINPTLATIAVFSLWELFLKESSLGKLRPGTRWSASFLRAATCTIIGIVVTIIVAGPFYFPFRHSFSLELFKDVGSATLWESYKSVFVAALSFRGAEYMHYRPELFLPYLKWMSSDEGAAVFLMAAILIINNGLILNIRKQSTILFCVGILYVVAPVLQHHLFEVKYPSDRTGIYFIPLVILLLCASIDTIHAKFVDTPLGRTGMRHAVVFCGALLLLAFVAVTSSTLSFYHHYVWPEGVAVRDAMRRIDQIIKSSGKNQPPDSYEIITTWLLDMNVNYYRDLYSIKELDFAMRYPNAKPETGNFYLLIDWDANKPNRNSLKVIEQWPRYTTTLYQGRPL